MTSQCRSGPGTALSAWPVPTLERTYPGRLDQGQQVRAALRSFLDDCPVADEVIAGVWELAANACLHSNSKLPGGQFAITVHDFTGDYVYAEVRDQGSTWNADLGTGRRVAPRAVPRAADSRHVRGRRRSARLDHLVHR